MSESLPHRETTVVVGGIREVVSIPEPLTGRKVKNAVGKPEHWHCTAADGVRLPEYDACDPAEPIYVDPPEGAGA